MLAPNFVELEFSYKRKLFYYLQLTKIVISFGALIAYYLFISKNVSSQFISFLPTMLLGLTSSSLAVLALSKVEKSLKISSYLSSILDIGFIYWGIYQSHFPFSTFFYWIVPFIIMSYYFTNIYFSSFLLLIFVTSKVYWTSIFTLEQQDWLLTVGNYEDIFIFSSIVFACFMFFIFHFKVLTRKQLIANLNLLLADLKSVNSFPAYNPNPIFEYSDKAGYIARNDSARKILSRLKPQVHAEIVLAAQQAAESQKPVRTKLKLDEKTYQLDNVYAEGQVNVYVADISEVEANILKAQEKEQYTQAIIDAIPGFLSWVDSDLNYLGVNKNMAKFFHLRPEEFIGKPLGGVTENKDQQIEIRSFVKELFASDKKRIQKELEYHYENKTYYSLITISKYHDNQSAVLVSIDYTNLKNAEKQVQEEQKRAQASAKLASFGEMAAGIAHEINNPLAIISGTLSIIENKMQKYPTDFDLHKYHQRLVKSVDRINKIIRGMKNLARDGQNDPFEFSLLRDIIDDSLTLLAKKCMQEDITLSITDYDASLGLECQTVQIGQLLVIFINNAIDAINDAVSAQQDRWLKIDIEDMVNQVRISVIDSGAGIPIEQQDKIFQPFYTTKEVGKGTGLGLSLAAKIIKHHNAELKIDNSSPHTKFDLVFPKYQQLLQQSS